MALHKLSPQELKRRQASLSVKQEYLEFLSGLQPGEGGQAIPSEEGVSKAVLKKQINRAAVAWGVYVRYLRSGDDDVVFEIEGPITPGRPRKRPLAKRPM